MEQRTQELQLGRVWSAKIRFRLHIGTSRETDSLTRTRGPLPRGHLSLNAQWPHLRLAENNPVPPHRQKAPAS